MPELQNNAAMKAGIYIRVSTEHQIDKDSLRTQEERLRSYCQIVNLSIFKVYKDAGLSAKDTNRPALNELIKDIKAHKIDVVLVTKLDRITRSLRDLLRLMEFFETKNIHLTSISENIDTTSATGRFFYQLLGLIAQLEREVTAERVATDMRHRAETGRWTGGVVPFGYMTQLSVYKKLKSDGMNEDEAIKNATRMCPENKKLYIDPADSETIKWIFNKYIETNSVRKVGTLLNAKGTKTPRGELWPQATIHRILRTPTYIGKTYYGKRKTDPLTGKLIKQDESTWTVVNAEHGAIISEQTFNQVQELLSMNSKKPTKPGQTYLLTGLIKCGLCGRSMSGYTFTKKGSGKSYSYYKCWNRLQKGKTACKGLSLPRISLENFIIDHLKELSQNHIFLSDKKKIIEAMKDRFQEADTQSDMQQVTEKIKILKDKLEILLDKLECSLIDDEDFKPRYNRIKFEIKTLEEEKLRIDGSINYKQIAIDNLTTSFDEITSFGTKWDLLDDIGKSMRLRAIVKEIRATKENIELDLYLDVVNLSNTDRGSWLPPA